MRRVAQRDEEALRALGWAVRKDKEIHVGMAREIPAPVGDETHEIRYWEVTRDSQMIGTANELYVWLTGRFFIRNPQRVLQRSDSRSPEKE
jgi:hypothetical protein